MRASSFSPRRMASLNARSHSLFISDYTTLEVGEVVFMIGSPKGLANTPGQGIKGRSSEAIPRDPRGIAVGDVG